MTTPRSNGDRRTRTRHPAERTYCAFNQTGESFVGLNIRCADTPRAKLRGLLWQFRDKPFEGLWIVPSRGLHSVGLLAPRDLIYLDAQNRVIHLVEYPRPLRIAPMRLESSSVLEMAPHTIYSSQTHLGDQLLICHPQEMEVYLKRAVPALSRPGPDGRGGKVENAL